MWPQKWKASARWARSAAATKPLPLSASSRRPVRARKPRRELVSATVSLSTYGLGCGDEQALELEERVEGPLGPHLSVRGEHDRVRSARHVKRRPYVGVRLLVEELQLDLRVGGGEAQRRLESRAERAARRREDGERERRSSLEALDQVQAAAELRAFVLEREGRLRGDRESELAELPRERQQSDPEAGHSHKRGHQADRKPGIGRRPRVRQERQCGEGGTEQPRTDNGRPPDPRTRAEAATRRSGS